MYLLNDLRARVHVRLAGVARSGRAAAQEARGVRAGVCSAGPALLRSPEAHFRVFLSCFRLQVAALSRGCCLLQPLSMCWPLLTVRDSRAPAYARR